MNVEGLIPEQYYFLLFFNDPTIEIPLIETYVYITKTKEEFIFQDAASYIRYGNCYKKSKRGKCEIVSASKDVVSNYDDLDGLIEKLLKLKRGEIWR